MSTTLDLIFPVRAARPIPLDHGYLLFSALSARQPALHQLPAIGIFNLKGRVISRESLDLNPGGSLRLRSASEQVGELTQLANTDITLAGVQIHLGLPRVAPLGSTPCLSARIATIKGFQDAAGFMVAARLQLERMGCRGRLVVGRRRVVKIGEHRVVGFAVDLLELSDEHSRTLQAVGLGGRRHMGCGLFLPRPAKVTPRHTVRGRTPAAK